jgi:DNA modification methylase
MAKVLNRKFIGIDISKEYVKLSEKRLKNLETKQKKLFDNH